MTVVATSPELVGNLKEATLQVLREKRAWLRPSILTEEVDKMVPESNSFLGLLHRAITFMTWKQFQREVARRQAVKELLREGKIAIGEAVYRIVA
jgi:hypothetical protein